MTSTPRHVVFGTGAVALATMAALRRRGETVRMVNRSGTAPGGDDVEVLGGDAADPALASAAPRPAPGGPSCSPPCGQGCWPPAGPPAPGWSAWKTSTPTAAPPASP